MFIRGARKIKRACVCITLNTNFIHNFVVELLENCNCLGSNDQDRMARERDVSAVRSFVDITCNAFEQVHHMHVQYMGQV